MPPPLVVSAVSSCCYGDDAVIVSFDVCCAVTFFIRGFLLLFSGNDLPDRRAAPDTTAIIVSYQALLDN